MKYQRTNKKSKYKLGQTQISFGMIFSVILIIVFIAFAVYGIIKFLDVQKFAQVESFKKNFQADIDNLWGSSIPVDYPLPNKIKQVCFVDDPDENMYFVSINSHYMGTFINHIDITKIIASSTSKPKTFCINTSQGEISMNIKNTYNEILVIITK